MKVSVVMPVYNKADHLQECLDSIYRQSLSDMEIIAVDDKSTDGSLQILKAQVDKRLRIIELDHNLGHPGATQAGMAIARGEYIVRCDADDINHPEFSRRRINTLPADGGRSFYGGFSIEY